MGKLEFSEDDIQKTQRGLDASGIKLPNFSEMGAHFGEPQVPQLTEEEIIFQALTECEYDIVQLQAIIRGYLLRQMLYNDRYILKSLLGPIIALQSIIRAKNSRKVYASYVDDISTAIPIISRLQAISRAKIGRKQLHKFKSQIERQEPAIIKLQSIIRATATRQLKKQVLIKTASDSLSLSQFQAIIRGNLARKDQHHFQADLQSSDPLIVDIQAVYRGKSLRHGLSLLKLELRNYIPDIILLQSHIRGSFSRYSTIDRFQEFQDSAEWVLAFQSIARGFLVRRDFGSLSNKVQSLTALSLDLQAFGRGFLVRKQVEHDKLNLIRFRSEILALQSLARGMLTRTSLDMQASKLDQDVYALVELQSIVRGSNLRREIYKAFDFFDASMGEIVELQSIVRAKEIQVAYNELVGELRESEPSSIAMQSLIRGNAVREDLYTKQSILFSQEPAIVDLQSIIRGDFVRDDFGQFLDQLDQYSDEITALQSVFRGVMVRFNYDLIIEEFEDAMDSIVLLQAHIRGYRIRKDHNARMEYFRQNMDKVIKIQSFVRAKKQGDAYKSLTSSANPPLSTVKNFVHLLNDSDLDFEQEVQLEQNKKQVKDEIAHNQQLEQFITQLDVKIALLLKNKITIDEVIRHRNKGAISVSNSGDLFDLKALNKVSRKRLELYQGFFYLLQTQPTYFARLFKQLREAMVTEKEIKDIEGMVKIIFASAKMSREEFFYLRLVSQSINEEISNCDNVKAILRGNFIWWKLLAALNRTPKERKTLKSMLYPAVHMVSSKSKLDLESDPLAIYRKSIMDEELRTAQKSSRNPHLPVAEAIKLPDVRATYISNMQHLRELTTEFLTVLSDNVDRLPYHIRFAAREIYNICKTKFPEEGEDRLLSVIGHVVFNHYLNPAIISADNFGIVETALGPTQTRNLTEITKVLSQISLLKPFSREDIYLRSLNEDVKIAINQAKDIFREVINVPDLGQQYNTSVYDDLTSHERPLLYIKTSDIFSIHSLVAHEIDVMAPDPDDGLRVVINDLGPLPNDASEILNIAKFTDVKLELNPSFCKIEDPEAEVNSLLVSIKRCLIYVLRVQSGPNLLEVLVSPVEEYNELKYREILAEEAIAREKKRKTHSEAAAQIAAATQGLGDLESLTYRELKLLALEKILELESYGKISRDDNYQALLNSIAQDIKSKRDRRIIRKKEIDEVQRALTDLNKTEKYLQNKLQTYNNYIEQAMATLQTKKGGSRKGLKGLLFPFSKQYFHHRDLQKAGKVPKFGSYKYSANDMFDKGVLVELNGYTENQYSSVSFTFSSDEVGVFKIEAAYGSVALPGATTEMALDELLNQQYNNQQYIILFDNMVKFNTNLMLHFIFKKFYGENTL